MKNNAGLKYIFYVALFLVFIIFRINLIVDSGGLYETEYKTFCIASASFPFGVLKNAILKDYFMPAYYLLIHFPVVIFKSVIFVKIINIFISFATVVYVINIGRKLLNKNFGIFLGLFLSLNHFFLHYTNLIAPYCLNFLIMVIAINYIIDYLRRPDRKNLKNLTIINCVMILCDSLGIIFVLTELIAFYLLFSKKPIFKRTMPTLIFYGFFAFLAVFIVLVIHYFAKINLLIPDNYKSIALNINGLYLILNEFLTPYLSFNSDFNQQNTTLGMLYSFFLNPKISNMNSLKILITLFYSSFLPMLLMIGFTIKSYLKDYKLRFLITVGLINFGIFCIFVILEYAEMEPINLISMYITELLAVFYGIFLIKDNFIKGILLFCLIAIQVVNPNLNSLNVSVYKNHPVGGLEAFKKDYGLSSDDFIVMPYMSDYAKIRYKNFNFFDFDYNMLRQSKRNAFVKTIINKKMKSINKNNLVYAYKNYLTDSRADDYLTKYFMDNFIQKAEGAKNIIFVVEKLNSRPISREGIYKVANISNYNPRPRALSFRRLSIKQNQSAMLYNALKSKILFDIYTMLKENYYPLRVVEYANVDGEFTMLEEEKSYGFNEAVSSHQSDYVFFIFKKAR